MSIFSWYEKKDLQNLVKYSVTVRLARESVTDVEFILELISTIEYNGRVILYYRFDA